MSNIPEEIRNLTVTDLRVFFQHAPEQDVKHIVDALRAAAGDTSSFERTMRVYDTLEIPLVKYLRDRADHRQELLGVDFGEEHF